MALNRPVLPLEVGLPPGCLVQHAALHPGNVLGHVHPLVVADHPEEHAAVFKQLSLYNVGLVPPLGYTL
jgi:hypothetical protein